MILSPQRGLSKESQKARGFCPAVSIAGVNAASNSISTIFFFILFRELHYSRPSHIYKLEDKDLLLLSTSSSSHLSPDRRVLSGGVITVTIPAHQVESRRLQTDWADSSLSFGFLPFRPLHPLLLRFLFIFAICFPFSSCVLGLPEDSQVVKMRYSHSFCSAVYN